MLRKKSFLACRNVEHSEHCTKKNEKERKMKLRPISDKKGVEISTNTIIIVIIALLVLVISAAFFAGGMAQLVQKIKEIFYRPGAASLDVVKSQCESLCETGSINGYARCINVDLGNNNIKKQNCFELLGASSCQNEKISDSDTDKYPRTCPST